MAVRDKDGRRTSYKPKSKVADAECLGFKGLKAVADCCSIRIAYLPTEQQPTLHFTLITGHYQHAHDFLPKHLLISVSVY